MSIVWAAVTIGAAYALIAQTYNITFAIGRIFNFALAAYVMIGAFTAYQVSMHFRLPYLVALLLAILVGAVLGLVEEETAIRPLLRSQASTHSSLVTTVGFSVALEGAALLLWGPDTFAVPFPGSNSPFTILGGRIQPADLTLISVAVVSTVVIQAVHKRTRWGLMSQAMSEDRNAAALRGINIRMMTVTAFILSGALAAGYGVLIGTQTFATYNVGDSLLVFTFVALAIGGFGSYLGCLAGGMIVGFIQEFSARWLNPDYSLMIVFACLIVILMVRPTGLLGSQRVRLV